MAVEPLPVSHPLGPPVHKHVQVREYVKHLIEGAAPGTPAPSERELVQRFGVARMTVRQALDVLVGDGLLERVPGRGTFVAHRQRLPGSQLLSFTEEMERRGMKVGSRTLLARLEAAGRGVAKALEVEAGTQVVHWQRLRYADETPMCVSDTYLVAEQVPGFLDREDYPASLYAELTRCHLTPSWGEDSVDADVARGDLAALLGIRPSAPVLRVSRRAFHRERAVEVSRSTYRADRFTLWLPVSRPASVGTS